MKSTVLRKPCAAMIVAKGDVCSPLLRARCTRDLLLTRFGAMQVKSYFSNYGE